jgi:hypothetical protein
MESLLAAGGIFPYYCDNTVECFSDSFLGDPLSFLGSYCICLCFFFFFSVHISVK